MWNLTVSMVWKPLGKFLVWYLILQALQDEYKEVVAGYKAKAEEDVRSHLCDAFNALMKKNGTNIRASAVLQMKQ